jgi:hypothetical protein
VNSKVGSRNILVAGIPGSGKTTYCQWLEQEKGFLHLDIDELLQDRSTEQKLALIDCLRHTAEKFLRAISKLEQPVAIDWGFPPWLLSLVELFKVSGFSIWWLDGDRDAAKAAFIQQGTPGRSLEAFAVQMKSIEQDWPRIQEVFEDNIIYSVSAGRTHAAPEYIYGRMFSRRSR